MVFQDTVEQIILRRGHVIADRGVLSRTLLGAARDHDLGQANPDAFYEMIGRKTFRKVARRVLAARGATIPIDALTMIAGRRTREYVDFLRNHGIAERTGEGV